MILSIIAFGAGPIARTVLLPATICAVQKRASECLKQSGRDRGAAACAARQQWCVPAFSPHPPPASPKTVSGHSGAVSAPGFLQLLQSIQSMQSEPQQFVCDVPIITSATWRQLRFTFAVLGNFGPRCAGHMGRGTQKSACPIHQVCEHALIAGELRQVQLRPGAAPPLCSAAGHCGQPPPRRCSTSCMQGLHGP